MELRMARIIFCVTLVSALLLAGCVQANVSQTSNDGLAQSSEDASTTIWRASATLRPVDDDTGSAGGFVEIDVRDDLTFIPTVRLNLPKLSEGYYEVWLSRDDPPSSIHVGPLLQDPVNNSYYLGETSIKLTENIKHFMTVVVTTGQKGEAEDNVILRGTLRIVSGMRLDGEDALDELFESLEE